jgi:hypothetical protein
VIEETASNAFKYREPHTKVRHQAAPELAPLPPRRMKALNTAPRARPSSSPTHASAHHGAGARPSSSHACKRSPRRPCAHHDASRPPKIRVNISIETATEATIEAAAVTAAEAFAHGEKPSTGCLGFIPQGAVPGDQFLHIAICNQNRAGVALLTPTQVRDWSVIGSD